MRRNLKAEMIRQNIEISDIAKVIGKTERSVRQKIKGEFSFTLEEALTIRDAFFAGIPIEYLFAEVDAGAKDNIM